jgi:hypothetical protein
MPAQTARNSCADVVVQMEITSMGNTLRPVESELHSQFRHSVITLSNVIATLRNSMANYYQFACFDALLDPTEATK